MKVQEIMTSDPACCVPGDTVQQAAQAMKDNDCGLLPVVEDEQSKRLIGLVSDRDLALRVLAKGRGPDTLVRDAMTDGPDAAHPDDDISRVEQIMTNSQVRRVPVIDQNGSVVGIVAQADLARARRGVSDKTVGEVVEKISQPG